MLPIPVMCWLRCGEPPAVCFLPSPPPACSLDHFQPEGLTPEQRQLFQYIEDADLWRCQLPGSRAFTAGLASLRLEYDAQKNPAIFDQLLAQTPQGLIALGEPILAEQQRLVAEAVGGAFEVSLGGGTGAARGWGRCLAVRVGEQMAGLRSQLGNALAEESARRGLRAVAVVAYIEVGGWVGGRCPSAAGAAH
jgi:hypothetical protein